MKNKKLLILPLLLLMAGLLFLVEQGGPLWQSLNAGKYSDRLVIATIQGEDFTIANPEKQSDLPEYLRDTRDIEEIKMSALRQEVLFREACSQGFRVSDQEVDDYIADLRASIPSDPEYYPQFLQMLEDLGQSEDECWEEMRPVYVKLLTTGEFYNQLEPEYWKTHQWTATQSFYDGYYQEVYLPQLFKKYHVVLK